MVRALSDGGRHRRGNRELEWSANRLVDAWVKLSNCRRDRAILRYRIAGLDVDCDVPLVGRAAEARNSAPDVVIRMGLVPTRLAGPAARGPNWEAGDQCFLLDLPGTIRFLVSDGGVIIYEPAASHGNDAAPFLAGICFAALLRQRGVVALRAAAVAIDGKALILCGSPGAGASTLAAAMCGGRGTFVADDLAAIALADNTPPRVWPDGGGWNLFPDSIRHLGLDASPKGRLRAGVEKYAVTMPAGASSEPVPIAAICVVREWRPSWTHGMERLPHAYAAQALLDYAFGARLILALGRQSSHMADTMAMLRHVPVFRMTRTADFGRLNETAAEMLTFLRAANG